MPPTGGANKTESMHFKDSIVCKAAMDAVAAFSHGAAFPPASNNLEPARDEQ